MMAASHPEQRATTAELTAAHLNVSEDRALSVLLDVITDFVMVLNDRRQIVAVNKALLNTLGLTQPDALLGMRPGEAFGCIHSREGFDGCGTGIHCTVCGAVTAIMGAQNKGTQVIEECRLIVGHENETAFDLEVVVTPYSNEDGYYFICTLRDISALKRRNALERVFFHDVINTAGGIHGLASILVESENLSREKDQEYKEWMHNLSMKLIEEIEQQRHLVAAEKGDFHPAIQEFPISRVLEYVKMLYANHEVSVGKALNLQGDLSGYMISDETIVRRVLGNLVKNALEATNPGGAVTVSFCDKGSDVVFSVHNENVMPEEVQLQIFKRSFSTKAASGRGIGAYSIKLFSEKYLNGKIDFISREPDGTIFTLTLPKNHPHLPFSSQTDHIN